MKAKISKIQNARDINEVLEIADLNFIPEKHPVMTGSGIDCPDNCAIVRSDTKKVLSVMGNDYTPLPLHKTFAVADTLREKYNMRYKQLTSLDSGRKIQLTLEGKMFKVGNDDVRQTLMIRDSFDGGWKQTIMFGAFRLICLNGLYVGNLEHRSAIRHTKNAEHHFDEALRIWSISQNAFGDIERKMNIMAHKFVNREKVEKFLDGIVGKVDDKTSTRKKNQREEINRLFLTGQGNKGQTAWDLYNSVSEYYQHANGDNEERRIASSTAGTGYDKVVKAFNLALFV